MNKHGPMPDPWTMLAVIGFQSERTPPKNYKAVFGGKFCPVKIGPKIGGFRELRVADVKFLFSNPEKAHSCAEPRCLTYCA